MVRAVMVFLLLCLLVTAVCAGDNAKDFTLTTVDGKTINYKAANGMPMVINIGSHW